MRARLVSERIRRLTVKWANGDEEPKTVRERELGREAPTKRAKVETKCFVCHALGREAPNLDASQMMCYNIGGKATGRNDVYAHLCCILCARPSRDVTKQEWWDELERAQAWPTCPPTRECSTDKSFVPFEVGASELKDEFVFRVVMTLQASSRRFAGRAPPYNRLDTSASLWRSDDRGTINGLRALVELAAAAESEGLSRGEITLWGAVVYRLINRLSTFSRWAAVCSLREKHGVDWDWKKNYEDELYGETPDAEAREIAVSGSSLLGRLTECRDKWALPEVKDVLDGKGAACTVRLPRPSEIRDFVAFVAIETDAERGIMTAEHQSGAGFKAVCKMLPKLAKTTCPAARTRAGRYVNLLYMLYTHKYYSTCTILAHLAATAHLLHHIQGIGHPSLRPVRLRARLLRAPLPGKRLRPARGTCAVHRAAPGWDRRRPRAAAKDRSAPWCSRQPSAWCPRCCAESRRRRHPSQRRE